MDAFRLDKTAYCAARDNCETWLKLTSERLDQYGHPSGSADVTERQLDSVKVRSVIIDAFVCILVGNAG